MKIAIITVLAFFISVCQVKSEKITVDSKGNVYVLGQVELSITFSDSTTIVANQYPWDSPKTYLVKLDPAGNVLWYKLFDVGDENFFDIQVDNTDRLVLASLVMGPIELDSITIIQDGFQFLIARFDPDGTLLWYNLSSKHANGYGISIAIDGQDNIYTKALFTGNFHFHGPDTISTTYPTYKPFIAKFDSSGNNSWLQKIDSWQFWIYGFDVDDAGNVVIAGNFKDTIILQGDTLIAGEVGSSYWAKFDTDGSLVKIKMIQCDDGVAITNVGAGSYGHFSYLGHFRCDTFDIEGLPPTLLGPYQAGNFIAHVDETNIESWILNFSGAEFYNFYGIDMDTTNNTYLYTIEEDGYYYEPILNDFVGTDLRNSNYMIKMDSSGHYLCHFKMNNGLITDAEILEDGQIYIVAKFENTVILNDSTYTQADNSIFIAAFDSNCNTTRTSLISNPITGVQQVNNAEDRISVFPNPTAGKTTISFSDNSLKPGKVILYNMEGSKLMEWDVSGMKTIELDIETLNPGMYIVQVLFKNQLLGNFKIVKF